MSNFNTFILWVSRKPNKSSWWRQAVKNFSGGCATIHLVTALHLFLFRFSYLLLKGDFRTSRISRNQLSSLRMCRPLFIKTSTQNWFCYGCYNCFWFKYFWNGKRGGKSCQFSETVPEEKNSLNYCLRKVHAMEVGGQLAVRDAQSIQIKETYTALTTDCPISIKPGWAQRPPIGFMYGKSNIHF